MAKLEETAALIRAEMESDNSAREVALRECREVIRLASRTIRAVHRLELETAIGLLIEGREKTQAIRGLLREHPQLYYAGYVHDSQKEFVEAAIMIAIVSGEPLPSPQMLEVENAAYLNGLAEAGSESRRYVLDRLRAGEVEEADRVLGIMDDIYFELITIDFPDAITGGLRRTTDAFRAVLERTRGDLTLTIQQRRLQAAIEKLKP